MDPAADRLLLGPAARLIDVPLDPASKHGDYWTTDADGSFAFRDVYPGECTLQVLAVAVNQTTEFVFGAGERRVIDVVVDPERKPILDPATREEMLREGDTVKVPMRSP